MSLSRTRPSLCPFLYPPFSRAFSTTSSLQARGRGRQLTIPQRVKAPERRLVRPEMADVRPHQIPDDLGMFKGTVIMPTGRRRPSILFSPLIRLKMEWLRLKTRAIDIFTIFIQYKFGYKSKPRPKLQIFSIVPEALEMHAKMYERVIGNHGNRKNNRMRDMEALKKMCCEGLESQLVKMVEERPAHQSAVWERKGVWPHLTTRVVSNRATPLPREDSALRQTTVKIRSQQRVLRYDTSQGKRDLIEGTDKWEDVLEYLVLQRRIIDGEESKWKIWGTAEESDPGEILKVEPPRKTKEKVKKSSEGAAVAA